MVAEHATWLVVEQYESLSKASYSALLFAAKRMHRTNLSIP